MTAQRPSVRRRGALVLVAVVASTVGWLSFTSTAARAEETPLDPAVQGLAGAVPAPSEPEATTTTTTAAAPASAPAPRAVRTRRAVSAPTTTVTSTSVPAGYAATAVTGYQAIPPSSTYQRQPYPPSAVIPKGGVWPAENPGVHPFAVGLIALLSAIAGGAAVVAAYRRPALLSLLPWSASSSVEEPTGVDAGDVSDERREELVAE